jgi:NDP-sugar pyrophosphorylase family protein
LEISLELLKDVGSDVETGENCRVSASAEVKDSILWDDVVIGEGACVQRSVLGDGVCIAPGERIENAAVVRAELVRGEEPPPKALQGEVHGENFVVQLPR